MSRKERTKCIIFTILLSIFCLIPIYQFKNEINIIPIKLYRVYLNGRNIGTIKSKEKLEKYIDENQQDLKEIYNVDTIYPPKGLYISEFVSYNDNSILESDIYNTIKDNDYYEVIDYAYDMGIRNAFIQEGGTQSESFIPDFDEFCGF